MKDFCNRDAETSSMSIGSQGCIETVERFRQKFIKEARNIAKLKHRNIISVIDIFEENGTAYYVMEHVGGGSLADKVQCGALPEADAVRYIGQVASALALVHSKRMMHLDIKPSNILVDEDDNAILIDFGLSKQYDKDGHQTSTTPVGISHGYAPMEQYRHGGVSNFAPASDIYSLGATLYKLVTGDRPPEAGDIINEGLPFLPQEISVPVSIAIEEAMRPRSKDRPQSVEEFMRLVKGGKKEEPLVGSTDNIVQGKEETVLPVGSSAGEGGADDETTRTQGKGDAKSLLDDERFSHIKPGHKETGKGKLIAAVFILLFVVLLIVIVPGMCSPSYETVNPNYKEQEIEYPLDSVNKNEVIADAASTGTVEQLYGVATEQYQDSVAEEKWREEELEKMKEAEREKAISAARVALNSCLVHGNAEFRYTFFFEKENESLSERDKKILVKMSGTIKKAYGANVSVIGWAPGTEPYGYRYAAARTSAVSRILEDNGVSDFEMISQGAPEIEYPYRATLSLNGVACPLYVFFGKNSYSLSRKDRISIGDFANAAAQGGYSLVVRAFSGTSGGVELSKKRADAVSAVLKEYGARVTYPSEYAFVADGLTSALSDNCVIISFE